jgi:hypothetical protein
MNKCIIFLLTALLLFNIQLANSQVRDTLPRRNIPVVPSKRPPGKNLNDTIKNNRKSDSLARIKALRNNSHFKDSIKKNRRIDSLANASIATGIKKSNKTDSASTNLRPAEPVVNTPFISKDSLQNDSNNQAAFKDSIPLPDLQVYQTNTSYKLLLKNRFINVKQAPVYFLQIERKVNGKEILFYSICVLVLLVGLFKTFFYNYFNNLFRVFFNTSLRQSQLTDQLVQARLPSFILNILFILSAGFYTWLLLTYFSPPGIVGMKFLLPICIGVIAIIYLSKYLLIKFMGWLGGIQSTTNNYIFIIFLINKIIGILLIPFIILLAFANPAWVGIITTISFLLLGLFFLARYAKSYGSLSTGLKINPFHFLIYIIGAEIIPLLILYKLAVDYVM